MSNSVPFVQGSSTVLASFPGGLSNLTLTFAEAHMRPFEAPWWFAGGWAIDLFLGEQTRPHKDVDIAVLRQDQAKLRASFADWSLRKVAGGVLSTWRSGESLDLPVHEVHAEKDDGKIEFLLNEMHLDMWRFRREPKVCMRMQRLSRVTTTGKPYLCPEVVLLYKAKQPRDVDQADFERVLPRLDRAAIDWLSEALALCHPKHEWLSRLT